MQCVSFHADLCVVSYIIDFRIIFINVSLRSFLFHDRNKFFSSLFTSLRKEGYKSMIYHTKLIASDVSPAYSIRINMIFHRMCNSSTGSMSWRNTEIYYPCHHVSDSMDFVVYTTYTIYDTRASVARFPHSNCLCLYGPFNFVYIYSITRICQFLHIFYAAGGKN